eukprot:334033-Rhodomonas_salina.4
MNRATLRCCRWSGTCTQREASWALLPEHRNGWGSWAEVPRYFSSCMSSRAARCRMGRSRGPLR